MRSFWREIWISIFMGMVVPALIVSFADMLLDRNEAAELPPDAMSAKSQEIPMLLRQQDEITEVDMEEYLLGVVLAEMPASFESEALKAQTVVARTYTRKAYITGGKHGDGSVCTTATCCQAYVSPEDYLQRGGNTEDVQKILAAVADTAGYVLMYEGELIEATYFSCSGGRTEDAVAVWGTDFPYLRSVESPGEENAPPYTDSVAVSAAQLRQTLGRELPVAPDTWFGKVTYTAGGGVETMEICGESYTGTELRALLGLRSTAFSVTVAGEDIIFTTKGYGHRVGMSQYGADAMAVAGSDFREILAWYYPGTEIIQIETE